MASLVYETSTINNILDFNMLAIIQFMPRPKGELNFYDRQLMDFITLKNTNKLWHFGWAGEAL